MRVLTIAKPCRDKMNAWWVCVCVLMVAASMWGFGCCFFCVSLYKLETFRALMKHPRQTIVADQFTICSSVFCAANQRVCVRIKNEAAPFRSMCFACASLSVSKPSNKLITKPDRPVINDQNATKSYMFPRHISPCVVS